MTNNNDIEIPKVNFDKDGELIITASPTSSKHDFDFYEGKWKLRSVLNGFGTIDNYLETFEGVPFEGMSVKNFNPKTRLWSIYWGNPNEGILQPTIVGSFENNVAHFFTKDIFNDKKIVVVFRWDVRDKRNPIWSQAFSEDNGKTWEWNWHMYFSEI